jgi:Fuc2NAc and GlcNAc transferase
LFLITITLLFFVSVLLTWLLRVVLLRKAILDIPNARSLHATPTPRGGGIVFILLFFLGLLILFLQHIITTNFLLALLGGGILVAAIGCWDDFKTVPARYRVLIHVLAACWALYCLGGFPVLLLGVWKIYLGWFGFMLAVIAVVWFINLYNFMDGIDGLAGTQGVSVGINAGIILWLIGAHALAYICFLLAAVVAGFLVWNWPLAKIFMGDVGSGTLGFIFAVLIIAAAHYVSLSPIVWFILLAIFILDATFTLLRRMINREKLHVAHCSHAYQCLVKQGATHLQVTVGTALVNVFILLPLAYWGFKKPVFAPWIFLIIILVAWVAWRIITRRVKLT